MTISGQNPNTWSANGREYKMDYSYLSGYSTICCLAFWAFWFFFGVLLVTGRWQMLRNQLLLYLLERTHQQPVLSRRRWRPAGVLQNLEFCPAVRSDELRTRHQSYCKVQNALIDSSVVLLLISYAQRFFFLVFCSVITFAAVV